ncbi:MAG: hypothetical protein QXH24_03810 [Candidatus Bathyarchaeia archaeon]
MELSYPVRLIIELLVIAWAVNIWWWVAVKVSERRAKRGGQQ